MNSYTFCKLTLQDICAILGKNFYKKKNKMDINKINAVSKLFSNLQVLAATQSRVSLLHNAFLQSDLYKGFPSHIKWDDTPYNFVSELKMKCKSRDLDLSTMFQFVFEKANQSPIYEDLEILRQINDLIK